MDMKSVGSESTVILTDEIPEANVGDEPIATPQARRRFDTEFYYKYDSIEK